MATFLYGISGSAFPSGLVQPTGTRQTGLTGQALFSGFWMIESQSLDVDYHRTPTVMYESTDQKVTTLAGADTRTFNISSTHLNTVIHAFYKVEKVYGTYDTDYFLQYQKFGVLPEPDQFGQTYGSLTGTIFTGATGSGFSGAFNVLGPAGRIITTQPYIKRIPWNDSIHQVVNRFVEGTNAIYYNKNSANTITSFESPLKDLNYIDYNFAPTPPNAGTYVSFLNTQRDLVYVDYLIPSNYSTTGEHPQGLINFLNTLGQRITNNGLIKLNIPISLVPLQPSTVFGAGLVAQDPDAKTGISQYNKDYHNYG